MEVVTCPMVVYFISCTRWGLSCLSTLTFMCVFICITGCVLALVSLTLTSSHTINEQVWLLLCLFHQATCHTATDTSGVVKHSGKVSVTTCDYFVFVCFKVVRYSFFFFWSRWLGAGSQQDGWACSWFKSCVCVSVHVYVRECLCATNRCCISAEDRRQEINHPDCVDIN